MQPRVLARTLALGRVAIGLALFVAPRRAAETWIGRDAHATGARLLARGLGARDVAIGVGQLVTLEDGDPAAARRWLEAGAAADLADLSATVAAREGLDRAAFVGTLAVAGGAAAAALWVRTRLR